MKGKCLLFYYFTDGGVNVHDRGVMYGLLQQKLVKYSGKKTSPKEE